MLSVVSKASRRQTSTARPCQQGNNNITLNSHPQLNIKQYQPTVEVYSVQCIAGLQTAALSVNTTNMRVNSLHTAAAQWWVVHKYYCVVPVEPSSPLSQPTALNSLLFLLFQTTQHSVDHLHYNITLWFVETNKTIRYHCLVFIIYISNLVALIIAVIEFGWFNVLHQHWVYI